MTQLFWNLNSPPKYFDGFCLKILFGNSDQHGSNDIFFIMILYIIPQNFIAISAIVFKINETQNIGICKIFVFHLSEKL